MATTFPDQTESLATPARAIAAWRWPLAVVALALGAFLIRLPYLDVPLSADEGGYATAAYWWARGDTLYREITITRPQGIFVVFRAIDALGLGTTRGVHLVAALWVALSTVALLAVAARLWDRRIGFAAATLYAATMAVPWFEGYQANAELFMTLPLLLGIGALHRGTATQAAESEGGRWLVASGLLGAIALLLKPSAVALLPFGVLWLILRWRGGQATTRATLRGMGWFGAGWTLGLAPALLHGLATVPDRYLRAVVLYRVGEDSLVGGSLAHQLDYFATNTLYIVGHLPLILFAPLGLLLAAHGGARDTRAFLALWLITAVGGVALGGNWFLHYYQQLLPPLAIALALAARWLVRRPLPPARFAVAVLAGLATLPLIFTLTSGSITGVAPRTLPGWEPGVSAAAPIASYVAARTTASDTIYVAYDHADIYYLSGRRPAARWLHFRELGRTPGGFAEQVALIADPATAPRFIVGAQAFDRWGFDPDGTLRTLVARDYTLETTIDGIPLYRRNAER